MDSKKIRAKETSSSTENMIVSLCKEIQDISMSYSFLLLLEEHFEVSEALLKSPLKMLSVFNEGLLQALHETYEKEKETLPGISMKSKVHIRITNLPRCRELYRNKIPDASDLGRILCTSGTAVRTTSPKMLECQREYICLKCKHVFIVMAEYSSYYSIAKPARCPNPEGCYSGSFKINENSSKFLHTKDYQEIKLQEQVQKLSIGNIPRSIWVTLEDDLVDSVQPGNDIMVCGIVLQRWQPPSNGSRPSIDMVNNKQRTYNVVTEELCAEFAQFWHLHELYPLNGRNKILASFCPQVYGLYVVKLAIVVALAGGVQNIDANGTRTRGESHLLLVGDPGTGKSQFLKYISTLVPQCVLIAGVGTTSAGLTVSAIKEEGEWTLEAGALVLADGGVCCIDEFSSLRESDRVAIHEAMEQQTISVAKAGLVSKLNSRCTVIAATNPKGNYDPEKSLSVNVALGSPLLSRFDIILVLLDTVNPQWDKVVSRFILKGCNPLTGEPKNDFTDLWSLDQLKAYFCYIRTLHPKMTSSADAILSRYFQMQRQADGRNQARTTVRLLESLVRLSQGHARLMMREEVLTMDAVVAVTLMEASMCGTSVMTGINPLHSAFPQSPTQEYRKQVEIVLRKLELFSYLNEEMAKLERQTLRHNENLELSSVALKETQTEEEDKDLAMKRSRLLIKCFTQDKSRLTSNIVELDEESAKGNQKKLSRTVGKGGSSRSEAILSVGLDVDPSPPSVSNTTVESGKFRKKKRMATSSQKRVSFNPSTPQDILDFSAFAAVTPIINRGPNSTGSLIKESFESATNSPDKKKRKPWDAPSQDSRRILNLSKYKFEKKEIRLFEERSKSLCDEKEDSNSDSKKRRTTKNVALSKSYVEKLKKFAFDGRPLDTHEILKSPRPDGDTPEAERTVSVSRVTALRDLMKPKRTFSDADLDFNLDV